MLNALTDVAKQFKEKCKLAASQVGNIFTIKENIDILIGQKDVGTYPLNRTKYTYAIKLNLPHPDYWVNINYNANHLSAFLSNYINCVYGLSIDKDDLDSLFISLDTNIVEFDTPYYLKVGKYEFKFTIKDLEFDIKDYA